MPLSSIDLRFRTACLSDGPPGRNPLINARRSEESKGNAPFQIRTWIPTCYLGVPFYKLLLLREARGSAWCKSWKVLYCARVLEEVWRCEIYQVRDWMANCRHFPARRLSVFPMISQKMYVL